MFSELSVFWIMARGKGKWRVGCLISKAQQRMWGQRCWVSAWCRRKEKGKVFGFSFLPNILFPIPIPISFTLKMSFYDHITFSPFPLFNLIVLLNAISTCHTTLVFFAFWKVRKKIKIVLLPHLIERFHTRLISLMVS